MLRIVLLVSLALAMGCTPTHHTTPRGDVSIAWLHSLCQERSQLITDDLYICGTVVANDKMGEITKALVLADPTGGVELKIDSDDVDGLVGLNTNVRLRCSGLALGREGHKVVMGLAPKADFTVERIGEQELLNYLAVSLTDEPLRATEMTIRELTAEHLLCYVSLGDVHFVEEELHQRWCLDNETTIHHLTDGCDTLRVVTAPTAEYATSALPSGVIRCTGIVDWVEGNIALRITNKQF